MDSEILENLKSRIRTTESIRQRIEKYEKAISEIDALVDHVWTSEVHCEIYYRDRAPARFKLPASPVKEFLQAKLIEARNEYLQA